MNLKNSNAKSQADVQVSAIRKSGLTIYDIIAENTPLYLSSGTIEYLLNAGLNGFSTSGMPIRTRSKIVKIRLCESLGYVAPASFKRTKPRFPGQNLDLYIQKSDNLQIWNDTLDCQRRYALVREEGGELVSVRVVTGSYLASLKNTGTLTQKYQARLIPSRVGGEAVSVKDTALLTPLLAKTTPSAFRESPTSFPMAGKLIPIGKLYEKLSKLIGRSLPDIGSDQERNHGAMLQRMVCEVLGYPHYSDNGQFPDIPHQLLEVKLQTAQTIDLGGSAPSSITELNFPAINSIKIRNCDVRYAIFSAVKNGGIINIIGFHLTTGMDFFSRFPQCGGLVINKKLQIPLPDGFFHAESLVYA